MSVDPAFLFYPAEASEDTQFLNRLERGAYFDLLKAQKKFGRFSLDQIKKVLGNDFESVWPSLKICLSYVEDMYFIGWADESIQKRRAYSESRRNNRKGAKPRSYDEHMNNISSTHEEDMSNTCDSYAEHMGNGNRIRDKVEVKGGMGEKEEGPKMPIVQQAWNLFAKFNPKYPFDRESDFKAIYAILKFIAVQSGIPKEITQCEPPEIAKILSEWERWCTHYIISDLGKYDLTTIERFKKQQFLKQLTDGNTFKTREQKQQQPHGKSTGAIIIADQLAERLGIVHK